MTDTNRDQSGELTERELRLPGLVENWREFAEGNSNWHDYNQGVHEAVLSCAEELEEALDETYWLVYLYTYDENDDFLWAPVGIVEDRNEWRDWWDKVVEGEIELPATYRPGEWWVSDKPISFGLYGENDNDE